MNRAGEYLQQMLEAAHLANDYIAGMEKGEFLTDTRTQQAAILNLMTIGEASAKLIQSYPTLLAQFPAIPWRNMQGMRNRIAHGYFDIDLNIVWETLTTSIPTLIDALPCVESAASDLT